MYLVSQLENSSSKYVGLNLEKDTLKDLESIASSIVLIDKHLLKLFSKAEDLAISSQEAQKVCPQKKQLHKQPEKRLLEMQLRESRLLGMQLQERQPGKRLQEMLQLGMQLKGLLGRRLLEMLQQERRQPGMQPRLQLGKKQPEMLLKKQPEMLLKLQQERGQLGMLLPEIRQLKRLLKLQQGKRQLEMQLMRQQGKKQLGMLQLEQLVQVALVG